MRRAVPLLLSGLFWLPSTSSFAGAPAVELVAGGFDLPVFVTAPPGDPRLFVVQQTGEIRIIESVAGGNVLPAPFLDLSGEINLDFFNEDERGLLSLAFPADYATSGLFYVLVATTTSSPPDVDGRIEVRRYQVSANSDVADARSDALVLSVPHPPRVQGGTLEYYHNGGTLAFAPDGALWASIGDGAGWFGNDPNNCAQTAGSPLGKLLRIDLDEVPRRGVEVPFGNPCPLLPTQNAVQVRATGLRNPWRMSFDRATGDLYVGDVGQDTTEEIDVIPAAMLGGPVPNFGWRAFEGSDANFAVCPGDPLCSQPQATTFPVHEYGHGFDFCAASVTGGYVYRGSSAALAGRYLFADFCQGFIRSFVWDGAGGIQGAVEDHTAALDPFGQIDLPVSFGEDGGGELYIVDLGFGAGGDGQVFLIPAAEPSGIAALLACLTALAAARAGRARPGAGEGAPARGRGDSPAPR